MWNLPYSFLGAINNSWKVEAESNTSIWQPSPAYFPAQAFHFLYGHLTEITIDCVFQGGSGKSILQRFLIIIGDRPPNHIVPPTKASPAPTQSTS